MGVPAHDERDFAFAKKYGLPIRQVVGIDGESFSTDAGSRGTRTRSAASALNSGKYDGLAYAAAVDAIRRPTSPPRAWREADDVPPA